MAETKSERTQPRPYREVLEERRAAGQTVGPAIPVAYSQSVESAGEQNEPTPPPQGEFLPEPVADEAEPVSPATDEE